MEIGKCYKLQDDGFETYFLVEDITEFIPVGLGKCYVGPEVFLGKSTVSMTRQYISAIQDGIEEYQEVPLDEFYRAVDRLKWHIEKWMNEKNL